MALTATTLAADITAGQTRGLAITSTSSGFPAVGTLSSKQLIQIDGEYMMIDKVVKSGVIDVLMRGFNGTTAKAHDILSPVITSSDKSDFPAVPDGADSTRPPYVDRIIAVGENGTIAVPTSNSMIILMKATALANTTLADPTTGQDGLRLTVTSGTDAAHVITGTFADGTTGAHTTATYQAFNGASMELVAQAAAWNTVSLTNVAIT